MKYSIYTRPTMEQLRWCIENFEHFKDAHFLIFRKFNYDDCIASNARWQYDDNHFYFRDKEDYIAFKLRFN